MCELLSLRDWAAPQVATPDVNDGYDDTDTEDDETAHPPQAPLGPATDAHMLGQEAGVDADAEAAAGETGELDQMMMIVQREHGAEFVLVGGSGEGAAEEKAAPPAALKGSEEAANGESGDKRGSLAVLSSDRDQDSAPAYSEEVSEAHAKASAGRVCVCARKAFCGTVDRASRKPRLWL